MGGLFGKPKVPKPPEPTPLPQEDDAAIRQQKLNQIASLEATSGRKANQLAPSSRLGDYTPAQTRTGSSVLSG